MEYLLATDDSMLHSLSSIIFCYPYKFALFIKLFPFPTCFYLFFQFSIGKGKEGFILGACRQGICFIPVILIFPFIWGLNGILYAQPIADVLSALITVFMAIPLHKSLTIAEQKMKTTSIPCDRQ